MNLFFRHAIILVCLFSALPAFCQERLDAAANQSSPLLVNEDSHIIVMEYEAWFGPNAVTFQGTAAKPLLQSGDMQAIRGGYDSADPSVIRQHVTWMENLGIDAAIADLTNNVSCIFDSQWFIEKYVPNCTPGFRANNQTIRDNTGNLFPAWSSLDSAPRIIPQLGGIDQDVLFRDLDGKTALEKEIDFFGALLKQYPQRAVIYHGKPLMLIFLGAAQNPTRADRPLWFQIRQFLKNHPALSRQYTFKEIAGYLDSQPYLWLNQGPPQGPEEIDPQYGFWSWVDRLNNYCTLSLCPYYPSYGKAGSRVENFTASVATAGQNGWGCPNSDSLPYCPDDALRFEGAWGNDLSYPTFKNFMDYARELDPIFLLIHQFNEFVPPDEGFDANTTDDLEPSNLWGFGGLQAVRQQIELYRRNARPPAIP